MLRTRADYERALAVVREVILAWDPHGLVHGGAPADEWDAEVAALVRVIPRIASEADASHAISRVFTNALGPDDFGPDACEATGRRLFAALAAAGLVGN